MISDDVIISLTNHLNHIKYGRRIFRRSVPPLRFSGAIFLDPIFLSNLRFFQLVLALMACVTPFMACGLTMGLMFFLGFRFGSILCVTPFLVLAIGVDDAYLMINAWQRITTKRR